MDRRRFLVTSLAGALAVPLAAEGQQARTIPRVGVLTLSVAFSMPTFQAFRQGLREQGYVEGQNIALELRFANGNPEKLGDMAAELVRMKVGVIVTESVLAAREASIATRTIPIVTAIHGDPVGAGLAASLTRPGGNVTGLSLLAPELSGKRLQLLNEVDPKMTRVAVIWNVTNVAAARYLSESRSAARSLGLQIQSVEIRVPSDLGPAFDAITAARPSAFMTLPDGMLLAHAPRFVQFAARTRLPALFPDQEFATAGGLMTYGPSLAANFRQAATYVVKILKGANPADLPIENPTKFELIINLKTARALGLAIPSSLLARADQVIE
jgi:putative tryptophan/tyrosine transport system substrate-binding protein